jgi:hypothetical protein
MQHLHPNLWILGIATILAFAAMMHSLYKFADQTKDDKVKHPELNLITRLLIITFVFTSLMLTSLFYGQES